MDALSERLLGEIVKIPLIDPHTHIDPHRPAARDLDDLLGYHYYTELAHSAGMDPTPLRSDVPAEERVRAIARFLPALENTWQYSWLLEIARDFFGFQGERIDETNVDQVLRLAEQRLGAESWAGEVFYRSNLEKVFLTNDFDDPLEGFDTDRYVPCLRTDDLVFRLGTAAVLERLRQATRCDVGNAGSLRGALEALFQRFVEKGARACAVSLPPDFAPQPVSVPAADPLIRRLLSGSRLAAHEELTVSCFVFWQVAELCREHGLPFDLMIGVHRNVYPGGVHQGRDLFNRLTSLHQFRALFNAFPEVTFPVSVLASDSNQELVAYSWIFPNVVPLGHWWYSNVPAYIEADARARLQAVPRTKQIGYYSDAYKLEFVLPKFNMYRQALARILAQDFVAGRRWSEEKAVDLARDVLRRNVERVFFQGQRVAQA
ncbi:MAG: glucuronate isomerase [Planctomycetes bacterium]|nr:glucuronate isomerase [Planctomycetota bacterium]